MRHKTVSKLSYYLLMRLMPCPSGLCEDQRKPCGVFDSGHLESPGEARGEGAGENIPEAGIGEQQCVAVCPSGDAGCVIHHPNGSGSPCLLSWAAVRIESVGSFFPALPGTLQRSFRRRWVQT